MPESATQYLSVKNWSKFQPKLKNGNDRRDWIRLDTHLIDDPDFSRLTFFERSLLIGIWTLRGRTGKNIPNDPVYISRALCIEPKQRHNVSRTVPKLVLSGFLILSNQQIEIESALQDKTRQDKTRQIKQPRPKSAASVDPPAAPSKPFSDEAIKLFECRYGQKPTWGTGDYVQLHKLLKLKPSLSPTEFASRYQKMIGSPIAFIQQQAGSLMYFCCNFDKFIEESKPVGGNGNGKLTGQQVVETNKQALRDYLARTAERDREALMRGSDSSRRVTGTGPH